VSVSGVIDYEACPKRFYWSTVRPLPRFSGAAARIGTQVHAWIERQSSGQATLDIEFGDEPDLSDEELAGEPGRVERLRDAFLASRFADTVPLYAERPFLLNVDGSVISGRIDAVFGLPDGRWEVVDYKTGRVPAKDDRLTSLQLDIYALACTELWGKRPEDLTLTYVYLASNTEVSVPAGDVAATRARVAATLRGIAEGRFEPTPGPFCTWCDFLPFCTAGTRHVRARDGGGPGPGPGRGPGASASGADARAGEPT
jgi:DNA helicase-2/ATP-dependent DNA helicase PcrA